LKETSKKKRVRSRRQRKTKTRRNQALFKKNILSPTEDGKLGKKLNNKRDDQGHKNQEKGLKNRRTLGTKCCTKGQSPGIHKKKKRNKRVLYV